MAVPWAQIVRFMPTIIEVSSELLKRTRRSPSKEVSANGTVLPTLETRVAALEDTERRAAELDSQMAQQLAKLTQAVTALHGQNRRLMWMLIATGSVAVIALVVALVR
jgi:ABC-type hemin transport system substrate-binding protein